MREWIANNLAEGTDRQKARWDCYTETQSPEYADAAKLLAEGKLLSPLSRGRYAWLYFNTVSPDSRKKGDFGKFLEQAVAAGVSEAALYRQQVQQVEESRVAAESVREAASRFTLATSRIDQLIEKIGAQKIEKDGKLDVAAYEQKIYSLNALLEEIRKNEGPTSMEPQQGNIQTEARLVLRHILNTSTKSRQTASAVLKSMDIDSAQILGSN